MTTGSYGVLDLPNLSIEVLDFARTNTANGILPWLAELMQSAPADENKFMSTLKKLFNSIISCDSGYSLCHDN